MCKRFYIIFIFILIIQFSICLNNYNSTLYTLYFNNVTGDSNINSNVISSDKNVTNDCIEPGFKKVCSGHGSCKSGVCNCDTLQSHENNTDPLYEYSGKFCEECPYCKGQRCKKLLPCVESLLRNTSGSIQCYFYYNFIESIRLNYNDKLCQVEDDNRCMIKFKYFYDDNYNVFIDIDKDVKCINGRKYILICWCAFLIYLFLLMMIFKML